MAVSRLEKRRLEREAKKYEKRRKKQIEAARQKQNEFKEALEPIGKHWQEVIEKTVLFPFRFIAFIILPKWYEKFINAVWAECMKQGHDKIAGVIYILFLSPLYSIKKLFQRFGTSFKVTIDPKTKKKTMVIKYWFRTIDVSEWD